MIIGVIIIVIVFYQTEGNSFETQGGSHITIIGLIIIIWGSIETSLIKITYLLKEIKAK